MEQTLPVLLLPVPPQASGFRLEAWGLCEGERLRRPREGSSGNWVWIQGLGRPDDFSALNDTLLSCPLPPSLEGRLQRSRIGISLVVQWLKLCAFTTGAVGSIPGQATKIPHVVRRDQ